MSLGPPVQVPATAVNWAGAETASSSTRTQDARIHALGPAPRRRGHRSNVVPPTSPLQSAREAVIPAQWVGTWDGTGMDSLRRRGRVARTFGGAGTARAGALWPADSTLGVLDVRSAVLTFQTGTVCSPRRRWQQHSDAGPVT